MVRKSASVMLVVLLAGCTAMRQDKYCKWALPVWGAALGGTGGGLGVSKSGDRDAAETAGGAGGGAIAGAGSRRKRTARRGRSRAIRRRRAGPRTAAWTS